MRRFLITSLALILVSAFAAVAQDEGEKVFKSVPSSWKWLSSQEVIFSYNGTYTDENAFSVYVPSFRKISGTSAPAKYSKMPYNPEGAVNLTYSPDSTMLAFTRNNDLYVLRVSDGVEQRLTWDGSELILNGYASWVYYEEILGRPSRYKAFWWSPDSRKIGFYRFDNSNVPMFPIYSPFGQDGKLNRTRYPKAGEPNPEVRIGMVPVEFGISEQKATASVVWADFDSTLDQYFGIPFWGSDSKTFYVAREPRIQNTLDLYAVDASDGSKKQVYHETYKTWLDWIEEVIFTEKGLYMARSFETGWEQIYFLSYDGKDFRCLTSGPNWRTHLVRVDEATGDVYYTANRDATMRACLYKADASGNITALTDPAYNVSGVSFSPDGKYFVAAVSNFTTPTRIWIYQTALASQAWKARNVVADARKKGKSIDQRAARSAYKVADAAGNAFNPENYALPQIITIKAEDGLEIPAAITYPKNFDPSKKYPVHVNIYGGPNTAYVRDYWRRPTADSQWWSDNGIINVTADSRAAGHNGRAGVDQIYKNLIEVPVKDFVAWANYFKSLPYVIPDKIGVEGFSFGGSMTTMLLLTQSDSFHYGIAGGGVYDWKLYDTHYTERFMETPQTNPDGYEASRVINYVKKYPVDFKSDGSVMLKITHGTGDDNVHYQNTLQLIDAMQKEGRNFELMLYPDGMHGYHGYQGEHSDQADRAFWLKYLKGE